MKKFLITAALVALAGAAKTQAAVSIDISIGDGYRHGGAPRYEAVVPSCPPPAPVYVPAPVYAPVPVYAPAPVYVLPERREYARYHRRYHEPARSHWYRGEEYRGGYRR